MSHLPLKKKKNSFLCGMLFRYNLLEVLFCKKSIERKLNLMEDQLYTPPVTSVAYDMKGKTTFRVPNSAISREQDTVTYMLFNLISFPFLPRNEVWRYDPKQFGTHGERLRLVFFRGFKWGLLAAVGTVLIERAFFSSDDHHHH